MEESVSIVPSVALEDDATVSPNEEWFQFQFQSG